MILLILFLGKKTALSGLRKKDLSTLKFALSLPTRMEANIFAETKNSHKKLKIL